MWWRTKLSFKQASRWLGGRRALVWVHCSAVLTAIGSGGDPQGTARNAGSEEELGGALGVVGGGGGGGAHICLSAGRDEWLGDNRASAAGRKMIPCPAVATSHVGRDPPLLPPPRYPHLLAAPVGKWEARTWTGTSAGWWQNQANDNNATLMQAISNFYFYFLGELNWQRDLVRWCSHSERCTAAGSLRFSLWNLAHPPCQRLIDGISDPS